MPPAAIVDSASAIARAKYSRKNGPHSSFQADQPRDLSRSTDKLVGAFIRACSDRKGHTYTRLYENNREIRSVIDSLGWPMTTVNAVLRNDSRFRFQERPDGRTAIALAQGYTMEDKYVSRTGIPSDGRSEAHVEVMDSYRGQHTSDEDDDYRETAGDRATLQSSKRVMAAHFSSDSPKYQLGTCRRPLSAHDPLPPDLKCEVDTQQGADPKSQSIAPVPSDVPPSLVQQLSATPHPTIRNTTQNSTVHGGTEGVFTAVPVGPPLLTLPSAADTSSTFIEHTAPPSAQHLAHATSSLSYEPLLDSSSDVDSLHSLFVDELHPLGLMPSLEQCSRPTSTDQVQIPRPSELSTTQPSVSRAQTGDRQSTAPNSAEQLDPDAAVQFVPASASTAVGDIVQAQDSTAVLILADIPMAIGPVPIHLSRKRDDMSTRSEHLSREDEAMPGQLSERDTLSPVVVSGPGSAAPEPSATNRSPQLFEPCAVTRASGAHYPLVAASTSTDSKDSTGASSISADLLASDGCSAKSTVPIQKARKGTSALRVHHSRPMQQFSAHHHSDAVSDGNDDEEVVHVAIARTTPNDLCEGSDHIATRTNKTSRRSEKHRNRRKRPLPTFRHTVEEEHLEYTAAYAAMLQSQINAAPVWQLVCAFEEPSSRHHVNTEMNTVKFWPYNLPYPGRRKGEAVVAVAGGCIVRCFRLSLERGVQELWCSVDESAMWPKETEQENFTTMEWTHELREDGSIPQIWRKWPLLVVAGRGREIKVLDGYSGTVAKVMQGHGAAINCLIVHPALPHCIATASADETIAIWDITAPVSKPHVLPRYHNPAEQGKRRKPYVDGERLCIFAGLGGHVESVLSIAFHSSLPLLLSGGVDCKLRIWQIPDCLPKDPSGSILTPKPSPLPQYSRKPVIVTFPIFEQASLHSHHIDHVEFLCCEGMILTRSYCYDSPGKRVVRVFRPTFFDTSKPLEVPRSIGSAMPSVSSEVQMAARWTFAGCSENIGDGTIVVACDVVEDSRTGLPIVRRQIMIPSTEPLVHVQELDIEEPQKDIDERRNTYDISIGDGVVRDPNAKRVCQLRSLGFQNAGWHWLVGVGEAEKLTVWCKPPDSSTLLESHLDIGQS